MNVSDVRPGGAERRRASIGRAPVPAVRGGEQIDGVERATLRDEVVGGRECAGLIE